MRPMMEGQQHQAERPAPAAAPAARRSRRQAIALICVSVGIMGLIYNMRVMFLIASEIQFDNNSKQNAVIGGDCRSSSSSCAASAPLLPWYRNITECVDRSEQCNKWANNNECLSIRVNSMNANDTASMSSILQTCPASCKVCDNLVQNGLFASNCFGVDQRIPTNQPLAASKTLARIRTMEDYMLLHDQQQDSSVTPAVRLKCRNRHQDCAAWAATGQCRQANSSSSSASLSSDVKFQCAPACLACEHLDNKQRCATMFRHHNKSLAGGVWKKGDLHQTFERIVRAPVVHSHRYNLTVHSRPRGNTNKEQADFPWLITLDDFVSESECDHLIELGHKIGFKPSLVFAGTSSNSSSNSTNKAMLDRTSSTAWCHEDRVATRIKERIATLTGIPDENSESLQLLRYEKDQFYKAHTDYIFADKEKPQGVRVLTAFLYLSNVKAGGGTHFPMLNMTIMPKRGRIVVWPSVLNEDPDAVDYSTLHEALPVEEGVKYSVNIWSHQRNYKEPFRMRCT